MKVGKAPHQAHVHHSVHKGAIPGAVAFGGVILIRQTVTFIYSEHELT